MGKQKSQQLARLATVLEEVTEALNETAALLRQLQVAGGASREVFKELAGSSARIADAGFQEELAEVSLKPLFSPRAGASTAVDEAILRELASQRGLSVPMDQLIAFRNAERPNSRPRYWAIANFSLHSKNPRLFLFDVTEQESTGYLCAHGRGSDPDHDGMLNTFSNEDGSNCSSRGIYVCAETYFGDNGYSMRLDGQEATNSRARHRAIVIHGASYVSPELVQQEKKIGRSLGCPAVENRCAEEVIDALKNGSLLNVWKA